MKQLLTLLLCLVAFSVHARQVTVSWELPTLDCNDNPIVAGDIGQVEIYVSESSIPAQDERCSTTPDPAPAGFTPIEVPAGNTSISFDLAPGKTYFLRARVAGPGGVWSNLSTQASALVPFKEVQPPTLFIINLN